jgi:hypothetical protein
MCFPHSFIFSIFKIGKVILSRTIIKSGQIHRQREREREREKEREIEREREKERERERNASFIGPTR